VAQDVDLLRTVFREPELFFVEAHELAPVVAALVERSEDLDDAGLVILVLHEELELLDRTLVPRDLNDNRLELIDRAHDVAEPLPKQPCVREAERRARLTRLRRLGAASIKIGEVAIATELAVEIGQRVERRLIAIVDVECAPVRLDGLLRLAELT